MKQPRARHRTIAAVVGLAAVLCAARPVLAEPAPPAAAEQIKAAKALFHQGVELFKAGDSEHALDYFRRSRAAYPSAANATNIAVCLDKLGRFDEALEMYEELITRHTSEMSAQERAAIQPAVSALLAKVGSIEVTANVDGTVLVDGRARGKLPLSASLRALPGSHKVRVVKDGHVAKEATVEVAIGRSVKVELRLDPEAIERPGEKPAPPPPAASPMTGRRIAGIVIGGLGVVGLGVGAAFGAMTLSAASGARNDPKLCPGDVCTPAGREAVDAASTKGTISTVAFVAGAAAAVAGVVLVVLPSSSAPPSTAVTVSPWAGREGGGLGVSGRF